MGDVSRISPLSSAFYPAIRRIKEVENNTREKHQEDEPSEQETNEQETEKEENKNTVEPRGNSIDILLQ